MLRRLIVNADDFGLSPAVNRGIWEAVETGTVTSVSMMVAAPGWEDALERLLAPGGRRIATPSVGLHLDLTAGTPLTRAPTLVDGATGRFVPLHRLIARALAGRIAPGDVEAECTAQLARLRQAGIAVTHLDSHRHVHALPALWAPIRRAAAAAGIGAIRVPVERPRRGDRITATLRRLALASSARVAGAASDPASATRVAGLALIGSPRFLDGVLDVVDALTPGTTELVVHPGYVDAPLRGWDGYTEGRVRELRALTSPRLIRRLERGDVVLDRFGTV